LDSDLDHGVQLTAVVLFSFRLRHGAITTLQEAQTLAFSRHAKAEKGNLVISQGKNPRKSQQLMPSPIKDGSEMGGKQAGSGSVNRTSQHR
jgi:hypothetical protein